MKTTRIDAQVVLPLFADRGRRCDSEGDAVDWARSEVGPNQRQVTLTAYTDSVDTFAIRHFTWGDNGVSDSGWRLWCGGVFAGGGVLRDMVTA